MQGLYEIKTLFVRFKPHIIVVNECREDFSRMSRNTRVIANNKDIRQQFLSQRKSQQTQNTGNAYTKPRKNHPRNLG